MKFKLVENVGFARLFVQELAYEAIDELGNKDLRDYLRWFDNQLEYYDLDKEDQETAITDFYIEAVDSGKIKRPKTMMTSALTEYIQENKNLLNDVNELVKNCPEHLRHELQLALDVAELNESLNEDLLTESINTNLRKFLISLLELSNVDWKSLLNVNSVNDIVVHHIGKDRTANSVNDLALMSDHWHISMHTKYTGDKWDSSALKNYPHILISDLLVHVADNLISQNKQDELAVDMN